MSERECVEVAWNEGRDGLNRLAGSLFRMLARTPGNLVISPMCLYQALALTASVTAGETRQQIDDVLGGSLSARSILPSMVTIDARGWGCESFRYSTGSAIWMDESATASDSGSALEDFAAPCTVERLPLGTPEAQRRMGTWLATHTGGVFSQAPEMGRDVRMALMSAMHLKDAWLHELKADRWRVFRSDDGTRTKAPFVLDWSDHDVLDAEGSVTLSLPLTSGCAMYLSLPLEGTSAQEYVASGDAWDNLLSLIGGKCTEQRRECKVYLPRFELASDLVNLSEFLREAGVTRLFEPGADFGPISPDDLKVDEVIQSTRLKVDEHGLEGASYVVGCVVAGGVPMDLPKPRKIVLNRPFAVAVASPDGLPLFVGTVEFPGAGRSGLQDLGADA